MPTYKITFPFRGKVKTQLKISGNRLVKPADVKGFERAVRSVLAVAFPMEERPIEGYLKFEMYHFTRYKKDDDGILHMVKPMDLDNVMKLIQDSFEPIYKNVPIPPDEITGEFEFTKTGKLKTRKVEVSPGVIKNDKYIKKAILDWVPVETEEEERIEVYITQLTESDLFLGPQHDHLIVELN
jgi:Holliday junction resolvase RusA-like endonuclease